MNIFIIPDCLKSKIFKIVLQKVGMNMSLFALGQLCQGRPVSTQWCDHISISCYTHLKFELLLHKTVLVMFLWASTVSQCVERILNKAAKAINKTFAGLKLMLQGFRIYFV